MDKKMLIMTVFLFILAGLGGMFIGSGSVDSTQSKQKTLDGHRYMFNTKGWAFIITKE